MGSQRKNGFLSICTGIRKSYRKNDSEKTLKNKQNYLKKLREYVKIYKEFGEDIHIRR